MKNPLTTLDELLYRQFEGITKATHEMFGWTKNSLANLTDIIASVSITGAGTLLASEGFATKKLYTLYSGCFFAFYGLINYLSVKNSEEEKTKKVDSSKYAEQIKFKPYRPMVVLMSNLVAGLELVYTIKNFKIGDSAVVPLVIFMGTNYFTFSIFSSYFQDQKPIK